MDNQKFQEYQVKNPDEPIPNTDIVEQEEDDQPIVFKRKPEEELKQLAIDIVDGKVYGSFALPKKPKNHKPSNVIYVSQTMPVITAAELFEKSLYPYPSDYVVDMEPFETIFKIVLAFNSKKFSEACIEQGVAHIYEYADKVDTNNKVNGYPTAWSFCTILEEDWKIVYNHMKEYMQLKAKFGNKFVKKVSTPKTFNVVFIKYIGDHQRQTSIMIFPFKRLGSDGYTYIAGYPEGVNCIDPIYAGASCSIITATESDEKFPKEPLSPFWRAI